MAAAALRRAPGAAPAAVSVAANPTLVTPTADSPEPAAPLPSSSHGGSRASTAGGAAEAVDEGAAELPTGAAGKPGR
eukprot:1157320-Pelagomonas_calceolata.AAC.1